MELLGNSKLEQKFSKLTMKALQAFKELPTNKEAVATDTPMTAVMRAAEREATKVILRGMLAELRILSDIDDPKEKRAKYSEVFDIVKRGIFRILDVSEVKSGKAHSIVYAMKGLDVPTKGTNPLPKGWEGFAAKQHEGIPGLQSIKSSKRPDLIWNRKGLLGDLEKVEETQKLVSLFDEAIEEIMENTPLEDRPKALIEVATELADKLGQDKAGEVIIASKNRDELLGMLANSR